MYFSYLPIYHYILDINYLYWLLFDLISCILCIGIFPNNKKNIFLLKSHSQNLWLLRPKTHLNQMNLINFKKKILLIINGKIISNIEKDKSTFEGKMTFEKNGYNFSQMNQNSCQMMPKKLCYIYLCDATLMPC